MNNYLFYLLPVPAIIFAINVLEFTNPFNKLAAVITGNL